MPSLLSVRLQTAAQMPTRHCGITACLLEQLEVMLGTCCSQKQTSQAPLCFVQVPL
jgi:hypothetical protein